MPALMFLGRAIAGKVSSALARKHIGSHTYIHMLSWHANEFLRLSPQSRTYFLEAETQTDAFEWIQTIGELLLRHQQGLVD